TAGIIQAVRRSKNGLTSDEVRAAIGDRTPAATVRGVLSKLAKRGELIRSDEWRDGRKGKPGQVYIIPADDVHDEPTPERSAVYTLHQLRTDYLGEIRKLDMRAQRDEMRKLYRDFILLLSIEQQVEDLRQLVKDDMVHWKVEQFREMMQIMTFRFR